MKKITIILCSIYFCICLNAQQPKVIADCTIFFSLNSSGKTMPGNIANSIVYIKGKDIRIDLVNTSFNQSVFYDGNSGNATILKTIGQSKYIANYTADEWKKENDIYKGITTSFTGNTKKILNYDCKEALLTLKNGKSYTVYYTPLLIPSIRENPYQFNDIQGLILEYQSINNENKRIIYTASSINFNPVPKAKFEIPDEEYRILH